MTMRYVIVLGRTEQILIFLEGLLKIRYVRKTDFLKKLMNLNGNSMKHMI